MFWNEQHTDGVELYVNSLPDIERRRVEAQAAFLFAQMKILGFAEHLPETLPEINRNQAARLLQLALNVGASCQVFNLVKLPEE